MVLQHILQSSWNTNLDWKPSLPVDENLFQLGYHIRKENKNQRTKFVIDFELTKENCKYVLSTMINYDDQPKPTQL